MELLINAGLAVVSYLIGSIPTGVLIARAFNVDLTKTGSGNIGATNVLRTLGKKMGVLTLIGDALKGAIPVLIAMFARPEPLNQPTVFYCALAAFFGHIFPVYLNFKGGKGVATALGIFLVVFPLLTLFAAVIFVLTVAKTKFVSLGSMLAALSIPIFVSIRANSPYQLSMAIIISLVVIAKHKDNFMRLLEGKENKIKL